MIYTKNVNKAIKLMFEKHKNQVDKQGIPYVFHPWHVAESMETEEETIVALLHDILEDTDITVEDLYNMNFEDNIIKAIEALTHKEDEDYMDYIKRVGENKLAIKVKIADLHHNMDKSRFTNEVISSSILGKYKIYQESLEYLENILNNLKSYHK